MEVVYGGVVSGDPAMASLCGSAETLLLVAVTCMVIVVVHLEVVMVRLHNH